MSLSLMKVAAAGHASKQRQSATLRLAERDGFTGTLVAYRKQPKNAARPGRMLAIAARRYRILPRAGDNTAVDFLGESGRLVR
jgi:hypothetical protein